MNYDYIYFSPHLDDAALSCGGQIFQRTQAGRSVLIVNIAAGDPPAGDDQSEFARLQHAQWQLLGDAVAARRREDAAACRFLGADVVYWPFPDCIYRHDPATGRPLYLSDAEIFGPVDPAEGVLVGRLAQEMASLPPARQVIAPLGVGNHVDHQLTRVAAEQTFGPALAYYEDYPYVEQPFAVDRILKTAPAWTLRIVPLSEAAVAARLAAIAAYRSQIATLFGDERAMGQQVRERMTAVGGERLWQRMSDRYQ